MHKKVFKLLVLQVFFLLFTAVSFFYPSKTFAVDAEALGRDIDQFFTAGAQGYYVWQYGGDRNGRMIAVDQYSFYRDINTDVCEILKAKSVQYPDKTIGVNIHNIGAIEFDFDNFAAGHMSWLKENCGVSAIRVFGKIEGIDGIRRALDAGQKAGVKILVAIGDYSNGGGGVPQGAGISWYESGYKSEYKSFVNEIVQNFSNHPALFGFELANEPHCGGDANAISAYTAWGADIGSILRNATPNVGYGQMASQNTTRCDSPVPGDYEITNNISAITMTSAHYYTEEEKQNALLALNIGIGLGKMFYIGEAPPGGLNYSEPPGYDDNLYPDYDVDETKSFIAPIRNVINSGTLQRTVEKLRKELALQGYQAYCATEGVKIEAQYNTQDKINKYFKQYSEPKILEVDAIETLNMKNAQYPLWRDVSNKQFLLTSLEEYFGFRDVYVANPSDAILMSSPINSLLSEPQLCVQGWSNLVAQQLACERLEIPGECELLTRPIPNSSISFDPGISPEFTTENGEPNPIPEQTEHTVQTLLDELKKYEPGYREGMAKSGCEALTTTDRSANEALLQGLMNTPTYFDRAYRYGFIVAAIHAKDPGTDNGNVATKIFNFFTKTTRKLSPRDEVLVAAFKLPDIGTNKGGGDDTGSQFWSDPLDLTRKVLFTKQQNTTHEDVDRPIKRQQILDSSVNAAKQSSGNKIFCDDGNTTTISCQNELTKAITDIINGTAEGCGEAEIVNVIKDIAGLDNPAEPYGRVFNADNGKEVLLNLFFGDLTHPPLGDSKQTNPQVAKTDDPAEKLKSLFTISESTWGPDVDSTTVDFYIVYPMGFELDAVETAMKGAFFTKAQLASLETGNTVDGFLMSGQETSLKGNDASFDYPDLEKIAEGCGFEGIDPITKLPIPKPCDNVEVSISLDQEKADIGVLGAKLGYWMRKVQLQLSARTSNAWKYFDSCKTTEEFLLGKCLGGGSSVGGGTDGGPNPGTGPGLACSELRSLTVDLPTMNELENMVCGIAKGDSNDAQLVWGMMQVDGSPFLRVIRSGESSMSCAGILINGCGASQIVGVLIPQCIDKNACPQAGYIADNTSDPWVQEIRNNPDIACNVETQLEFILRKRKSERSWLEGQYRSANNGASPSTKQMYYMMAARNYGLAPEIFTKPACEGAPEVQGCGGANYCECVMDTFPFSCN